MNKKFDIKKITESKVFGYAVAIGMAIGAYNKFWEKREKDRRDDLVWNDYKERHPEETENEEE